MNVLLIVYDNDSYIHTFPLGLAYIASAIRDSGHDVEIYNQDVYHYPEEHLINHLKKKKYDIIGMNIIAGYYQYDKLLKISKAIRSIHYRPVYVIGGHGVSPEPEYFLRKTDADIICIGEGERTIVEILNAIRDKASLNKVNGIAYLESDKLVITPRRELIEDIDKIPYPAWHLFPMDYYTMMREPHIENKERSFPVLSGRGCTFRCNFCYRMDKGFRARSSKSIINEIKILKERYGVTYINFIDELLMSSKKRSMELSQAIIDSRLNIKWCCSGRLNYATPEVLDLMKKSGCVFINYGIECMDDKILKNMNKFLTVKEIKKGIKATLKSGISPGFNIIFGNIDEDEDTLNKGVKFLLKYDDGSQLRTIRPVTPYPGSDLYYHAIKKGLIKDVKDFYENKHTNSDLLCVNFTKLSDDEFHEALYKANLKLINNYFKNKSKQVKDTARRLYMERDSTFRGFRQT